MREVYIPIEQMMQVRQIEIVSKPTEAVLIQAQQNKVFHGEFDLTVRGRPSYSGMRGIFMGEPVEVNEVQNSHSEQGIKFDSKKIKAKNDQEKKSGKEKARFNSDIADQIKERESRIVNQEAKKAVSEFVDELRKKPVDAWNKDDLRKQYQKILDKGVDEKDPEAKKLQSEIRKLLFEVGKNNGIDPREIIAFKKNDASPERQFQVRRLWENLDISTGKKPLTQEEILMREEYIRIGLAPIAGGTPMPSGIFDASLYAGSLFESAAERISREIEAGTLQSSVIDRQAERVERILDDQGLNLTPAQRELAERLLDSIDGLGKGARTIESEGIHLEENVLNEAEPFFGEEVQQIRQLHRNLASGAPVTKEQVMQLHSAIRNKYPINQHNFENVDENTVNRAMLANQHIQTLENQLGLLSRAIIQKERPEGSDREQYSQVIKTVKEKYKVLDRPNATKDEKAAAYEAIEKAIDEVDFAAVSTSASAILKELANESLYDGPNTPDGKVSREGKEHYGYALEYAVEKIIGRGDLQPTSDYPQFGFYENNNLEELIQSARKWNEGYFSYLNNLKGKRSLSHELFKNLKDRQTLVGIVTKALDPGSFKFIEDEVGGIPDVQAIYEKELGRLAGSNVYEGKGWVMFEDYEKIADSTVETMVEANNDFNLQKDIKQWVKNAQGAWESKSIGVQREMRQWERKRAFHMGRAITGAAIRRQIYSMYGDAPEGVADFVKSLEGGEQIMMIMSPLKMIAQRYFSQPGSQRFLNNWHHRKVEEASRKELRYSLERNGKKYGIYGATERATVLLDTGVVDIKSSGWRTDLMFLQQKEYGIAAAGGMSLYDFFQLRKKAIRGHLEHTNHHYHDIDEMDFKTQHHKSHDVLHEFQHDHQVEQVIAQQRLFLGVLMKRPDLSMHHKEMLWQKASELLPSRIAALMPQFSMDELKSVYTGLSDGDAKKKWDEINRKLFIAEHARVQADARGLKLRDDGQGNMVETDSSVRNLSLMHYINEYNNRTGLSEEQRLSAQDIQVIEKWQTLGRDMSGQLARVIWPHTPFLDDVPRTAWKNMGRNEMDRLLINDHNDWQEAYGGIIGLIANPAQKPDKLKEIMHHFVEKAKSPTSLGEAQAFGESFIYTYLKMAKKYKMAKATLDLNSVLVPLLKGDFKNLGRIPTSEMEEFNLQSGISYDEADIASILFGLAHLEVISDDPAEADSKGYTALMRLAKELKADGMARLFMMFRYFVQLFGFEFAAQVFSAILPEEVAKAAG